MPKRKHTAKPPKVLVSPLTSPRGRQAHKNRSVGLRTTAEGRAERRARLQLALREVAILAIEGAVSRAAVLNDLDNELVRIAMGAFGNDDLHLAALLIDVPDEFVKTRWEGLRRFGGA